MRSGTARQPEGAAELHATQTYSRGAPFVAFVLFAGEGAPAEVRPDFAAYQYDPTRRQLVYRSSANIAAWSELLWQQDYADGAPVLMLVCADWIQYFWKYRTSRAYRFVCTECGAFMQTALTAWRRRSGYGAFNDFWDSHAVAGRVSLAFETVAILGTLRGAGAGVDLGPELVGQVASTAQAMTRPSPVSLRKNGHG